MWHVGALRDRVRDVKEEERQAGGCDGGDNRIGETGGGGEGGHPSTVRVGSEKVRVKLQRG